MLKIYQLCRKAVGSFNVLFVLVIAMTIYFFPSNAFAVPQWCIEMEGPPCTGGPGGGEEPVEGASNRLSYPVILSEGVAPEGFPTDGAWMFETISDPLTECTLGVSPNTSVDENILCYYDGSQVWWLSQREANFWKAYSPIASSDVPVTAIDWGDLLESSPRLNLRRIRTEVTLYKEATGLVDGDTQFAGDVVLDDNAFPIEYIDGIAPPATCIQHVPSAADESIGCFAAVPMSDAVPGTEQSINEIQGTNFGLSDSTPAHGTAVGQLDNPKLIRFATTANDKDGNPTTDYDFPLGFHATIYSECARLVIQRITGNTELVVWDPENHRWGPVAQVSLPVVDIKTWQGDYSTEINASGTAIYGYNWNAQGEDAGTYRITFVLDNGLDGVADNTKEHCDVTPNTYFSEDSLIANPGEAAIAKIIPSGHDDLKGDTHVAGISYLDVTIKTRGGGGGGKKGNK